MLVEFQVVWVGRAPDGQALFARHPPAGSGVTLPQPRDAFFLTNDPEALQELLADSPAGGSAVVLDFAELFRYAFPSSAAESVTQMLAAVTTEPVGALALWQAGEVMVRCFRAMPLWALETVELLLREVGEAAQARWFGRLASLVRDSGKGCGAWQDSFRAEALRQFSRTVPMHADCSPLDVGAVSALLQPEGPLARLMPGYEPRAGQIEMLQLVVEAFNKARHLMMEAGTGVGKSVAYLLPAVLWAQWNDVPVVVSTNTRNLQAQLLEKDLPLVRQVVASARGATAVPEQREVRVALIKGRSNYVCLRRLGSMLEHGQYEMDRADMRSLARALTWIVQTTTGDKDELDSGCGMDGDFLVQLASLGEECAGRGCRFFRRCFLQKARDRSLQAHVVIANHALVFAEMTTPGVALPAARQIIFDEAHNLEDAATRHFSVEVTASRLHTLLRRLTRGGARPSGGLLDVMRRQAEKGAFNVTVEQRQLLLREMRHTAAAVEHVRTAGGRLFHALAGLLGDTKEPKRFQGVAGSAMPAFFVAGGLDQGKGRGGGTLPFTAEQQLAWQVVQDEVQGLQAAVAEGDAALQSLARTLRQAAEGELALHEDQAGDLEAGGEQLRAFVLDVAFVLAGSDAEHVFWVQRARTRERLGELWAAPLRIGPRLAKELYANWSSVIFCSATLRVGNQFDFVAGRLGVDQIPPGRLLTGVASSPFCYDKQCAVLAPTFLPEPGADGVVYAEQLSALMFDLFVCTRGRALGLFTSYEMMHRCARLLREPLAAEGIRLLVQGESGSREQITRIFREGGACVLLGTHSFWEGVDVVGEALSCVVMARLPFAAVGEPVHEARCEQVQREGGQGFMNFSLPTAVIRFRQGFGRLIRHRSDRGVVVVADPRLVSRNYGQRFQRSLPCEVESVPDREALLLRVQAVLGDQAST
jgi:Rad3-related DNA helicase